MLRLVQNNDAIPYSKNLLFVQPELKCDEEVTLVSGEYWYEYIPGNQAVFRRVVTNIVKKYSRQSLPTKLEGMQAFLSAAGERYTLTKSSMIKDWVDCYLYAYQLGFICLVYTKKRKSRIAIFTLRAEQRRIRTRPSPLQ